MIRKAWGLRSIAGLLAMLLLTGCSGTAGGNPEPVDPAQARPPWDTVLVPEASGTVVLGNEFVSLDVSNTQEGYFQISYKGSGSKAKIQLKNPDGTVYTYTLRPGGFETLPLTGGSGDYEVTLLEHAFDNMYAMVYKGSVQVQQVAEFAPYLYPNQYVWFTPDSQVYALGLELTKMARNDLEYVDVVYRYVVDNIVYDDALAASIPVEYLPDIDKTITSKTGICLDYAALMTALLRTQGIPTKVVVGYSGREYHAWISVYLEQTGWVDGVIYFDGSSWSRLDPTLAAGNRGTSVKDYVNNNDNYQEKYFY